MALTTSGAASTFSLSCFDRTDYAHEVRTTHGTYLDNKGKPLPSCTQKYKETHEGHSVVQWTSLASGMDDAHTLLHKVFLANNASAKHYRTFANLDDSNMIFVWPLRDKWDKARVQQIKEDILNGLCAVLQCKRLHLHPPQEAEAKHRLPEYGNACTFLISQLSKEHYEDIMLSTYYCVRLVPNRVVSFGVTPWDLSPCRYLATLHDVNAMDFEDPHAQTLVLQALCNHVNSCESTIHNYVGSNRSSWWGGNTAITNRTFVQDLLVPQLAIKPLVLPAQPEVQREAMYRLIIYAPGVFNDNRPGLREGWQQAVLGAAGDKINLAFCDATIAHKDWLCAYCLQISHTFRLCPIMRHLSWFDRALQEFKEEDLKLAEAFRKTDTEQTQCNTEELARCVASRSGQNNGCSNRGGGRGGHCGGCGNRQGHGHQASLSYGCG